ncbi:MAG TPA: OmpA family protein [Candidatus Binataceae bacterium]|nr:OmpA family protein [Candidatus Binataceae bacterium]
MKHNRHGNPLKDGTASRWRMLTLGALLTASLPACVFIHSSVIGRSTGTGTAVSTVNSDYGILRLTKPQDLTSGANAAALKQCPSGLLTDVQTQLSMRDWLVVQYYTLTVNAVCKPPPPPAPPPGPQTTAKVVLRGVRFDFNRYNIRPEDAAVLDEAAATLKENPGVKVDVNGYTDAVGSAAYNLRLSQKRAEAVADYLEKDGISADRLEPHGYGKTDFVATNSTSEGRAQNRRVELVPVQ